MGPSGEKGECLTVNLNDSNTEKGAPGGVRGPQGQKGEPGLPGVGGSSSTGGGVTYVRWGKSTCPDVLGTVMLYSGISAGTNHIITGGGTNYLCMPQTPEYMPSNRSGAQSNIKLHGVEWEHPIAGNHDHNAPCAVCSATTRNHILFVPAMTNCPRSWTREYYGYIMTANANENP